MTYVFRMSVIIAKPPPMRIYRRWFRTINKYAVDEDLDQSKLNPVAGQGDASTSTNSHDLSESSGVISR